MSRSSQIPRIVTNNSRWKLVPVNTSAATNPWGQPSCKSYFSANKTVYRQVIIIISRSVSQVRATLSGRFTMAFYDILIRFESSCCFASEHGSCLFAVAFSPSRNMRTTLDFSCRGWFKSTFVGNCFSNWCSMQFVIVLYVAEISRRGAEGGGSVHDFSRTYVQLGS